MFTHSNSLEDCHTREGKKGRRIERKGERERGDKGQRGKEMEKEEKASDGLAERETKREGGRDSVHA